MNAALGSLRPRVLVIEDEAELREVMVDFLGIEGVIAHGVGSLAAAEDWIAGNDCDVLVLDLGLPDGDGLAWLAGRPDLLDKGVVVTTARGDSGDRVAGARAGADAYLVKPVVFEELAPLIGNLMRRLRGTPEAAWALDVVAWSLHAPGGCVVKLTRSEHTLLHALAARAGQAVPRNDLILALGHSPSYYDPRRMEALVRRLRAKIADAMGLALPLDTVHGFGYAFTAAIELRGDPGAAQPPRATEGGRR